MAHKVHLQFTPPITRVHNIFRIRTVANAVTTENRKGKFPNDKEIGIVLAKAGLSKYRREKIKDRIMRRARDHLLTASYMGLLTRIGRPFGYSSTTIGKTLQSYGPAEECPKDSREEAVFIDKILRLKLTNVYDLQLGEQYLQLRSRPCLYILHVLSSKSWLHEHQIAVATGGVKCDPLLEDQKSRALVSKLSKYDTQSEEALKQFYRDFRIRKDNWKNMTRNVRPLLDWCQSVGLVISKEIDDTVGRWYDITDRGKEMLQLYGRKTPVWYIDLGKTPAAKAALLIFYQYAARSGFDLKGIMNERLRTGLVTMKISDLIIEMEEKPGLVLLNNGSEDEQNLDFSLEYDVPPEERADVTSYLKSLSTITHIKLAKIIESVEVDPIEDLKSLLEKEQQNMKRLFTGRFVEGTAISSDPLIRQVSTLIPSVGILGQYKSDFEKETVILLRLIGLNAIKYQGQLSDRCSKNHVARFFENNPDILIINGIECLVECKSTGEWKTPLSGVKSVPKELLIYQQYFPEVRSNSVILVYEGSLDVSSHKMIESILGDSQDVIFVTKNFLINCVHQPSFRELFMNIILKPEKFKPDERILA
jgi:hypothetical protein